MSRPNVRANLDSRRVVSTRGIETFKSINIFSVLKTQELFTLTYGAFVAQIVNDYEHIDEVNKQLDKM